MWEVNIRHIKKYKEGYLLTIPKNNIYANYQAYIPSRFISKNDYFRIINLPDNQKLKIRKDTDIKQITIGELKNAKRETNTL